MIMIMIIDSIVNSIGIFNIILLITLFLVVSFLKIYLTSKKGKGKAFEVVINALLKLQLNKNDYFIINNITLQLSENDTTQIDHIIVSRFGIFVIESKNFKGNIYGKKDDKYWNQSFGKGKSRNNKFQNPLLQNYKHTQSLIDILKLDKNKVFSIILFSALSKFKFTIDNVLQPMSLIPFIKKYRTEIYTKKEMLEIKDNINKIRLDRNSKTDQQHIQNLNNRFNNKNESNSGIAFIIALLIFAIIGLLISINFSNNKNIEKQSTQKEISKVNETQPEKVISQNYIDPNENLYKRLDEITQNREDTKKQQLIVSRLEMYIQQYEQQYQEQLFPITYYNFESKAVNNEYKQYIVKMYKLLKQEKSKLDELYQNI